MNDFVYKADEKVVALPRTEWRRYTARRQEVGGEPRLRQEDDAFVSLSRRSHHDVRRKGILWRVVKEADVEATCGVLGVEPQQLVCDVAGEVRVGRQLRIH